MTIEVWRVEIDKIDAEILRLLNLRASLAVRVGEKKRVAGLAVTDREREREVVERARRENPGPLDGEQVARLFRLIIRESRRAEARAVEPARAEAERVAG
jgi:chorismate mutase